MKKKYEVMTLVEYRVEVEASTPEEAKDKAATMPFTDWEQWSVEPAIIKKRLRNKIK